ncbi:MAG: hypothetical protein WCY23_07140 [Candidatus Omnitrophota bacterium]
MKNPGLIKKAAAACLGLAFTIPVTAQGPEARAEKQEKAKFTKDDLINSLKKMSESPKDIKTVCAMCYDMAVQPEEAEFSCNECGRVTVYSRRTNEGALVRELPYIKRSFESLPYDVSLDATGLCSTCGVNRSKVIVVDTACYNCGKRFKWKISNSNDLNMVHLLYLTPPINEIDTHYLGSWSNDPAEVRKAAIYIRDHVFCPECRTKIRLADGGQR